MARLFLLIDGYNLMHAAGLAQSSYGHGDLERSRNRLLKQLISQLDPGIASDTTVVFDGNRTTFDDSSPTTTGPLSVRFSSDGMDADSEIERLLDSHSSPRQVLVISSDHRLHKAARRRRSRCMDSEEFWSTLEAPAGPFKAGDPTNSGKRQRSQPSSRGSAKGLPKRDSTADDELAQEFLKIDVNEIKRSIRKEDR